jgi:hypothetical protein
MLIYRSNPTGSSRQQMINMAVAMHLGKTSKMEYQYRDIDPNEWINYKAWSHLRHHQKFAPPPPPSLSGTSETEEQQAGTNEEQSPSADDDDTSTLGTNPNFLFSNTQTGGSGSVAGNSAVAEGSSSTTSNAPVPSVVAPAINTPASGNGRKGRGHNAAKAQIALEEHQKKKRKAIAALTEVQKQRLQSQNKNYMRFTAIKYQLENCQDLDKLVKYQQWMDRIMDDLMGETEPPSLRR